LSNSFHRTQNPRYLGIGFTLVAVLLAVYQEYLQAQPLRFSWKLVTLSKSHPRLWALQSEVTQNSHFLIQFKCCLSSICTMWLYIHRTIFKSFGTKKSFWILPNFVKQFSHNTKSLISGDWLHISSCAFGSVSGIPPSSTSPIFMEIGHLVKIKLGNPRRNREINTQKFFLGGLSPPQTPPAPRRFAARFHRPSRAVDCCFMTGVCGRTTKHVRPSPTSRSYVARRLGPQTNNPAPLRRKRGHEVSTTDDAHLGQRRPAGHRPPHPS
jgi:hypothetical protein